MFIFMIFISTTWFHYILQKESFNNFLLTFNLATLFFFYYMKKACNVYLYFI